MIVTRKELTYSAPYNPNLPPPLCFTQPAGSQMPAGKLIVSGGLCVTARKPKLMMDPTDPTTWQRPYRFTI